MTRAEALARAREHLGFLAADVVGQSALALGEGRWAVRMRSTWDGAAYTDDFLVEADGALTVVTFPRWPAEAAEEPPR